LSPFCPDRALAVAFDEIDDGSEARFCLESKPEIEYRRIIDPSFGG